MRVTYEKQSYLNIEQKKLKQEILENLFEELFGKISKNIGGLLDNKSATDLLLSCIIIFSRESILNFINNAGVNGDNNITTEDKLMIVDPILKIIKEEIVSRLCN